MCLSTYATSERPGSDRGPSLPPGVTAGEPTRDRGGSSAAPTGVSAASPAIRTREPAGTPAGPPRLPSGTVEARPGLTPGYLVYLGGGDHRWKPLCVPDRMPRPCPLCRRRNRQYKGVVKWTGDRELRLLCGPCQRRLRLKYGFVDRPAPLCHSCWRRPRALKDHRRGRPSWRSLCWPCDRARRAFAGLPAYRGRRGVRRWLRGQVRRDVVAHRQLVVANRGTRLLRCADSPPDPLARRAHAPRRVTVCSVTAQGACPVPWARGGEATPGQTLSRERACAPDP